MPELKYNRHSSFLSYQPSSGQIAKIQRCCPRVYFKTAIGYSSLCFNKLCPAFGTNLIQKQGHWAIFCTVSCPFSKGHQRYKSLLSCRAPILRAAYSSNLHQSATLGALVHSDYGLSSSIDMSLPEAGSLRIPNRRTVDFGLLYPGISRRSKLFDTFSASHKGGLDCRCTFQLLHQSSDTYLLLSGQFH